MFDPETSRLLGSAPELIGLNPSDLPRILTSHYATLVSARIRGDRDFETESSEWSLEKIADSYELLVSISNTPEIRKPSAFVAATAQQIISRKRDLLEQNRQARTNIDRDYVDPALAAVLLFLISEQYADANEATKFIDINAEQTFESIILTEHIIDLAKGRLFNIIERRDRRNSLKADMPLNNEIAFRALLQTLIVGTELLASEILSSELNPKEGEFQYSNSTDAFIRVLEISAKEKNIYALEENYQLSYAGPHHLASLLVAVADGISQAALTKITPPKGTDSGVWNAWIRHRCIEFPFVWPNHREAISRRFHEIGVSAVLVLPTGAGKTTVSSLKIAATIAKGESVIFLAPTHALVEQLTNDLQEIFPSEIMNLFVSKNFEDSFLEDKYIPKIEVMTPEKCLAMLCFSPEAFDKVGLLVFDECHLLSPESGKIRRALDGMLCVLAFNKIKPNSDFLFLSAMLKNGEEFSSWINSLTGRDCVCVELLWKPSRQARGVVIYSQNELNEVKNSAVLLQNKINLEQGKIAKDLRTKAQKEIKVWPYAIWGLQHNWLNIAKGQAACTFTKLLDSKIMLGGSLNDEGKIYVTPNSNSVATNIAIASAKNDIKTIVFVNQKTHAVSVAKAISDEVNLEIAPNIYEEELWDALDIELGGLEFSLIERNQSAVPHNASMFRLERQIVESMYRRNDGSKVIVATPTLAQGLNLPAHLAILAGDKRTSKGSNNRKNLEAHEILNAAARAGRAGHLANGVVLLVPEPIISFPENHTLDNKVQDKLTSILPDDDRCVTIADPIDLLLDSIAVGKIDDADAKYLVNRLTGTKAVEGYEDHESLFNLKRSFGAFIARTKGSYEVYENKLNNFIEIVDQNTPDFVSVSDALIASQSGLSTNLILRLRERLTAEMGLLPIDVTGWINWVFDWLVTDEEARSDLLSDSLDEIVKCSRIKSEEVTPEQISAIKPAILAWVSGVNVSGIEKILLGGNGEDNLGKCQLSRVLIYSIISRTISYIIGLVASVVKEVNPYDVQPELSSDLFDNLAQCVTLGFDSIDKLQFRPNDRARFLSRVQAHNAYNNRIDNIFEDLDSLF